MNFRRRRPIRLARIALGVLVAWKSALGNPPPPPTLTTVFPAGCSIGKSTDVTIAGTGSDEVITLRFDVPGIDVARIGERRFRVTVSPAVRTGIYDVRAVGSGGISAPLGFVVGNRECLVERRNPLDAPMTVPLDREIDGRIAAPGEVDVYRFEAHAGRRVVVECTAARIDSPLRAVIEIADATGRRLAVDRGFFGTDPLIVFDVPRTGVYAVRVTDLTNSGSEAANYRLSIDTGPRVLFTRPAVVERGEPGSLEVFGWNLGSDSAAIRSQKGLPLESVVAQLTGRETVPETFVPIRARAARAGIEGFAYRYPESHAPVFVGVTDVPVIADSPDTATFVKAPTVPIPCEISGTLATGSERDWYRFEARRGEVIHAEAVSDRIDSPVHPRISIHRDDSGEEITVFAMRSKGSATFLPIDHADPSGRWRAPENGTYAISVKNTTGNSRPDLRQVYRLSLRREEPDVSVVAAPLGPEGSSLVVPRGGRGLVEMIALRRRGFDGPIRIASDALPSGLSCSDVWLGPGEDRAIVVVSAESDTTCESADLTWTAHAAGIGSRKVQFASQVRSQLPLPAARLVSALPAAVAGEARFSIDASAQEPLRHPLYGTLAVRHMRGGVVDVAVRIDRPDGSDTGPVRLTLEGLPEWAGTASAVVPPDRSLGHVSFWLPTSIPLGPYTFVVKADLTRKSSDDKTEHVLTAFSDAVTVHVDEERYLVEVDPFVTTKARRGETITIPYKVVRRHGFIGKTHTELAEPGRITDVIGLRSRGETFVGRTDRGSIQVVVSDDAPIGRVPFLRLFTVGTVEDEPVLQGARFLNLEIVE